MQKNIPNPSRITDMASAFYQSCTLFTASDLGVFTYLSTHANATATEVATALSLDLRGATLLLDGCVALELLLKEDDTYSTTPESAFFLSEGSPGDLSKALRYNRDVYQAWGKLPTLITTGAPVEKPEIHLGDDVHRTRTFVHSMHGRAMGIGRGLLPHLDYTACKTLLDIGGGPGTYSVLIAQANPQLSSTVLDLPEVVKVAAELISEQGMSERVHTLAGDYHTTAFPQQVDAINFFGMMHQESPADIQTLLHKAYEALTPGGIVYILDMMTDETHTQPPFSALFALNMALTTENGWVCSDTEMKDWLHKAGFQTSPTIKLPAPLPHWLIRAEKV